MTLRQALRETETKYGEARKNGSVVFVATETNERLNDLAERTGVSKRHLTEAALMMVLAKFEGREMERYEYLHRTPRRQSWRRPK